jgi:hypothetical protein
MALPSSPGAVGVFHSLARYGLEIPFAIPEAQAIAVAFTAHTFQYLTMCILGLIGLTRESLSLGWLREQATSIEEAE